MQVKHWCSVVVVLTAAAAGPAMAQNTMRVRIVNQYFAYINAGIGTAMRAGSDSVSGTLTLQSNGTWQGVVDAKVRFRQAMRAFGVDACPQTDYEGTQRLQLTATKATGFNAEIQTITYSAGTADGGYLELAVNPVESAAMNSTVCLSLYQDPAYTWALLPLNDARWNQPTSGYIIGFPQSGVLAYTDGTVGTFSSNIDLSRPAEALSKWTIRIER